MSKNIYDITNDKEITNGDREEENEIDINNNKTEKSIDGNKYDLNSLEKENDHNN